MKKLLFILGALIFGVYISLTGVKILKEKISGVFTQSANQILVQPSPTPTPLAAQKTHEILFVPTWTFDGGSDDISSYETVIYFGLSVHKDGVIKNNDEYNKLAMFKQVAKGSKKILAIRMTDSLSNIEILKDKKSQEIIVQDAIAVAKEHNFDGILLNLEVSALPFTSLVEQITSFNILFADQSHSNKMTYSITAYGDSFYRARPFDLKKLGEMADKVYVMAYDFHKAKGNPGPNFPLHGVDSYGYDMEKMINNFADSIKLSKLIVVFGMYGYDWLVDDKGVSQKIGSPLTLNQISSTIIDDCKHDVCEWERDTSSSETKASYEDAAQKHIVWFEDKESVKRKQEFLKQHGVGQFAYWAYSYF